MGLKIYREIDNNNSSSNDKNILLEFICNVELWNIIEIFDSCLQYDSENEEYAGVSEVSHDKLSSSLDCLRDRIEHANNNPSYIQSNITWLQEAERCYKILSKELNDRSNGFYILFI